MYEVILADDSCTIDRPNPTIIILLPALNSAPDQKAHDGETGIVAISVARNALDRA